MSPFSVERVRAYEAELPRLRPDELARFQIPEPTHEMRTPPWGGQPYRAYRDGDLPIEHLTSVPCAYRMYADSPRGLAYHDRQGVRREVTGLPEQSCSTFWDANNTMARGSATTAKRCGSRSGSAFTKHASLMAWREPSTKPRLASKTSRCCRTAAV